VAIRDEYANDKAKQSQAMMELYKKEKINPLGGCFPILVQMPGIYRLVLGADGVRGITASAACTLDKRPVGNGSILCVTHPDGRKYVLHAKT
jgi:membrane protein insertase Oxa1/YidC/SpoIIIJ